MNYNLGLHNFVEKYMPVRIQSIIGDTLRSILGPRERKILSEYEKQVLKKQVIVITGDTGLADLAAQEEALRNEIGAKINVDLTNSALSKAPEEEAEKRKSELRQTQALKEKAMKTQVLPNEYGFRPASETS